MLRLGRIQCFLLGLGIISLFYVLNRVKYVTSSEKVLGTFVFYVSAIDTLEGKLTFPIFEYEVKDSVYRFRGNEGSSYKVGEKVDLLLEDRDPEQPMLYTIGSFWLYPLFYVLFPLLIWSAFSLSYVNKNEKIVIDLRYPFFRKERQNADSKQLEK